MPESVFRDAVHQDIAFDDFEVDVINTPQMQRMRGIRQLGLAYLLYPSAHHTRLSTHLASHIWSIKLLMPPPRTGRVWNRKNYDLRAPLP